MNAGGLQRPIPLKAGGKNPDDFDGPVLRTPVVEITGPCGTDSRFSYAAHSLLTSSVVKIRHDTIYIAGRENW